MNNKYIYQAISMIDDDLIAEANNTIRVAKTIKLKRILVIAAATVLILGITVIAASIMLGVREGHTSNKPDYFDVPMSNVLQEDIGISVNIVPEYDNGYKFKAGYISELQDYDTEDNLVEKYKGLHCDYENCSNHIWFDIDNGLFAELGENENVIEIYKNSEIRYVAYFNKLVPGDYVPNEQDILNEKSGKYFLSYGADTVKIIEVQILSWTYDGIKYSICTLDNDISSDELVKMAKETIDYQEES